jgi:DNA-binding transcriptional MerR regulator
MPKISRTELCYKGKAMAKAKDSFSTGDAVRITGVSFRNIDYWARTKFIVPSIAEADGTGTERKYSFSDLLALRVARELREAGVSTQSLRRVVEFLRTKKGLTNPLAECRLIVTGADVQVATSREKTMSALLKPGQTSFAFVFDLARTVGRNEARDRNLPTEASRSRVGLPTCSQTCNAARRLTAPTVGTSLLG